MDSSKYNFVTVNEILSDVLAQVDDSRYEVMSKGFYISQIQQALEGLAFDTFFDIKRESFDMPENLVLEMPVGAFNVKEIYLFRGTDCVIEQSQKVWWKVDYFTKGAGYFAANKGNNPNDPFMPGETFKRNTIPGTNVLIRQESVNNHYFYNIQNGMIMFSSVCRNFPRVHVVYNGTGCEIGDIPIIPLFLREAVKDYVTEVTLRIMMAKDMKRWSGLWQIYETKLNRDQQHGIAQGSWYRAEMRVKTMSSVERSDLAEYYGRSSWQRGM